MIAPTRTAERLSAVHRSDPRLVEAALRGEQRAWDAIVDRYGRLVGAVLVAFAAAKSWLTAAIVESNLAKLAVRQRRLQRALRFYERARRHLDADRSPAVIARLRAEQAETELVLGLPEEALAEYEGELHELARCGLAIEVARARCGMGQALLRLGRRAAAPSPSARIRCRGSRRFPSLPCSLGPISPRTAGAGRSRAALRTRAPVPRRASAARGSAPRPRSRRPSRSPGRAGRGRGTPAPRR